MASKFNTDKIKNREFNDELIAHWRKILPEYKKEINELVEQLRIDILSVNPFDLLLYAESEVLASLIGINSEFQMDFNQAFIGRFAEYAQSVLVSNKPFASPDEGSVDKSVFIGIRKIS